MDPGTAIAVGQVSAKVLSLIWKYYSGVKDAKNDIQHLVSELQDLHTVFEKCEELIQKSSLATKISASASLRITTEQALSDVKVLEVKLDPGAGKKAKRRLRKRALKWPLEKNEVNDWVARFERHKTSLNLALSMDGTSLILDVDNNIAQLRLGQEAEEQNRQLGKLRIAGEASYDAYHRQHKAQCTIDTRVELLGWLQDWAAKHERPIFWLSGMAGTGKSTIALTLAHKLNNIKSLGATFFFSRASGSSKSAANFVGTLAYDLAKTIPQYKDLVCEAISGNTDVSRQGLRNQWEVLIIGPLSKIKLSRRLTMNCIIDALDECDSEDDIKMILQLLVEAKDLSTVDLGVFVTSRPEVAMRLGFGNMTEILHETLDLRDVPRQTVENDIAVFLRHELRRISQDHKLHDWPSQGDIQSLVERADGLFIYAATVCGFVEDKNWDPQERLFEVLRGGSAEVGGTVQLDEMYREVLRCALTKDRREGEVIRLCDRFKQVVGSIVTLSDTLSVSALANLLNIRPRNVELALGSLHSVLNIPKDSEIPVRLLHPSFHDFLSGEARCEDRRFFVDKVSVHGRLFTSCLETMSVALKRNMCNLKLPGSSPQDIQNGILDQLLPRYVQYACQYWLEHLACASYQQWSDLGLCDEGIVHRFFQQKYLYWLEAMCLMGKVSEAVLIVAKLGGMIGRDKSPALYSLIVDANRFNLSNRGIIEEAPLQIYAAALVFAPKESLIRKCYRDHFPTWLTRVPVVDDEWGSTLQILEGHEEEVNGIAFSPNGKYLASASEDYTVRLWDPATGALRSTLAGHSGAVIAVAFSNNCQLATASGDETLRIWDYISGVTCHVLNFAFLSVSDVWDDALPLSDPMEPSYNFRMAFAPNGSLAIGSKDGKLYAWNPDTAFLTTANFANFSKFGADILEFSSKGRLVFSWEIGQNHGREDEILSYEPDTASTHVLFSKTSTSHRELPAKAKALAFSADDQMALALDNGTIALWDMAKDSHVMLDCAQKITALAFSPDNQSLVVAVSVSSSLPNSLRFWDLSTHTESLIGMLASEVDNVTFSPDGRQLAFAYRYGRTVQLWDPLTKPANNIREGHTTGIRSLVSSRDGRYLASLARNDYVIRLWYPVSGKLRHALTGHSNVVLQVVFSPDSQQIASTSIDGTVRLWDPVEGTLHHILLREVVTTPNIVYTNDGKELACSFSGGVIRIWSSAKGELIQTLHGHSLEVRMAAFSPNGQMVAAGSGDGAFIVWDRAKGGDPLLKQKTGLGYGSVVFSNDGQYLASTFDNGAVAIWDPTKGELVKTLKIPDGLTNRIVPPAFSPDDQLVAVSLLDKSIRIWHVATGEHLETFQLEQDIMHLSFSADGTYLLTNSGEFDVGGLLENSRRSSHSSGFRWNMLGHWLMQGSRKMLWLPPDVRSYHSAYRDGLFALGRNSGEVTLLGVDLDYRPPG